MDITALEGMARKRTESLPAWFRAADFRHEELAWDETHELVTIYFAPPAQTPHVEVDKKELIRKLGRTATAIWDHLRSLRDETGSVVVRGGASTSIAWVLPPEYRGTKLTDAGRVPRPTPGAVAALARLRLAGLLFRRDAGFRPRWVVYGEIIGESAKVPERTATWMTTTARTWGGARKNAGGRRAGAGRPRKSATQGRPSGEGGLGLAESPAERNQREPVRSHVGRDPGLLNAAGATP